jgi:hypothetical protein
VGQRLRIMREALESMALLYFLRRKEAQSMAKWSWSLGGWSLGGSDLQNLDCPPTDANPTAVMSFHCPEGSDSDFDGRELG